MNYLYRITRHPGIYVLVSMLLVLLVVALVTWQVNRVYEADQEAPLAESLASYAFTLESGTTKSRVMGAAILFGLEDQEAKQLVLGKLAPDAPQVLSELDMLRTLYTADTVFLVNKQGVIVAYSSKENKSGTGKDISFRPYVQLAMQGTPNVYPAVGTTTDRGIYLAAPLRTSMNNTSTTIGVVVVKIGADKLDALLKSWTGGIAALLSPQGVVFSASREDWLFRMNGAMSAERLANIRRGRQFGKMLDTSRPPLPFTLDAPEANIEGVRYVVRSRPLEWSDPEGDWLLVFLDRRNQWWTQWRVVGLSIPAGLMAVLAFFWFYTFARNAVLRHEDHLALEAGQQYLLDLTDNAPVAVFHVIVDANGHRRYKFVSRRVKDLLGVDAEAIMANLERMFDHVPEGDRSAYESVLDNCIANNADWNVELRVILNGNTCWIHSFAHLLRSADGSIHYNGFIEDITKRKISEDQIRNLAFYDPLTKLPNRRMLNDRLQQMMAAGKRDEHHAALMFLDMDKFKYLNDTYGHDMGDLLLIEVASRISSCVRETDTVARFGGDEFVVMLSVLDADKAKSITQAGIVAEKIRAILAEPYLLKLKLEEGAESRLEYHCSSSIGIALFFGQKDSAEEILKRADIAMYQAKSGGRNQIRFCEDCKAGMTDLLDLQ